MQEIGSRNRMKFGVRKQRGNGRGTRVRDG
jgi:hypothetical protein